MKRTTSRIAALAVTLVLLGPSPALAGQTVNWVQSAEVWYHYGIVARQWVNRKPGVPAGESKIVSIARTTADESAFTEIGFSYDSVIGRPDPWTFAACWGPFPYTYVPLNGAWNNGGYPTQGTYQRYGLDYYAPSGNQRFFIGTAKAGEKWVNMTTAWEITNAEKHFNYPDVWLDNAAEWRYLQYKVASGNWLFFGGSKFWYDNDSYYSNDTHLGPTWHLSSYDGPFH